MTDPLPWSNVGLITPYEPQRRYFSYAQSFARLSDSRAVSIAAYQLNSGYIEYWARVIDVSGGIVDMGPACLVRTETSGNSYNYAYLFTAVIDGYVLVSGAEANGRGQDFIGVLKVNDDRTIVLHDSYVHTYTTDPTGRGSYAEQFMIAQAGPSAAVMFYGLRHAVSVARVTLDASGLLVIGPGASVDPIDGTDTIWASADHGFVASSNVADTACVVPFAINGDGSITTAGLQGFGGTWPAGSTDSVIPPAGNIGTLPSGGFVSSTNWAPVSTGGLRFGLATFDATATSVGVNTYSPVDWVTLRDYGNVTTAVTPEGTVGGALIDPDTNSPRVFADPFGTTAWTDPADLTSPGWEPFADITVNKYWWWSCQIVGLSGGFLVAFENYLYESGSDPGSGSTGWMGAYVPLPVPGLSGDLTDQRARFWAPSASK